MITWGRMVNQRSINILNAKYEEPNDKEGIISMQEKMQYRKQNCFFYSTRYRQKPHPCHHLNVIIEWVRYYQSFVSFSKDLLSC